MRFVIIGGGAAGVFTAITAKRVNPSAQVIILEKSAKLLSKVKISGGGRCNVTHACFDPKEMALNYPRGSRELLGPLHRFGPTETIAWFAERGVELKTEADGRMFPTTDSSGTIIDCLLNEARRLGVEIRRRQKIETIQKDADGFKVVIRDDGVLCCDALMLATGSHPDGHRWAEQLGHTTQALVPSLFTFNTPSSPLLDLSGTAVNPARIRFVGTKLEQTGPLLLTHWGFSGPAALKLSAWGARQLHAAHYRGELEICWLPQCDVAALLKQGAQTLGGLKDHGLPRKLWSALLERAAVPSTRRLAELSKSERARLEQTLQADRYLIEGKTTNKEEFVTCGGVTLAEVDFRTMESHMCRGLYFAGEILDIDGITGGFNFTNAWCGGWTAGHAAVSE